MNIRALSDEELCSQTQEISKRERQCSVALVLHLAEVQRRKLFAAAACSSLYDYCVKRLSLEEYPAVLRASAAKLLLSFPQLRQPFCDGNIALSGLKVLGPVLRQDNVERMIGLVRGKSKRQIEVIVRSECPRAPVASSIRRCPQNQPKKAEMEEAALPLLGNDGGPQKTAPVSSNNKKAPRSKVSPLSQSDYKVTFTASQRCAALLKRAKNLLSHRVSGNDMGKIVEMALEGFVVQLEAERFGILCKKKKKKRGSKRRPVAAKPTTGGDVPKINCSKTTQNTATSPKSTKNSRYIPRAIKREVAERDAFCCTFRDKQGQQCRSPHQLEFHHKTAFAKGGKHSAGNLTLHCRLHNAYLGELEFGERIVIA